MIDPAVALACASAALAAAGVAALLVPPTRRLAPRVRPYTVTARARLGREADLTAAGVGVASTSGTIVRLFGPPGRAFVARLGRLLERRNDETLALQLRQAGYVDVAPDEYRSRVAVYGLAAALAGAALGALALHSAPAALGLGVCGAVFGTSRLRGRLERGIEDRRERLRLELYTVNQLLAMHVRTGAGPVQATQRVVDRGAGAVVEELTAVLATMRNGVSEPEAFRRAAELTPEPAAARTYKLFAAGAERGVDLADGLRALSEDLRDARREEIRQTATKRRAAMLVPTIAVLAPVMLLFIAAPLPSIVFGGR
ncbi:MAG TPA: type II secretion system F family protein [Acidimicrobiia bacterium]|nr:type II secretion system F family protein [Acidimicrobiia bacterium]